MNTECSLAQPIHAQLSLPLPNFKRTLFHFIVFLLYKSKGHDIAVIAIKDSTFIRDQYGYVHVPIPIATQCDLAVLEDWGRDASLITGKDTSWSGVTMFGLGATSDSNKAEDVTKVGKSMMELRKARECMRDENKGSCFKIFHISLILYGNYQPRQDGDYFVKKAHFGSVVSP